MILKKLKVKVEHLNLITNCYIVEDEETKETMVIDPGSEPEKIIEMLDILEAKLKYIFITHCHAETPNPELEADSRLDDGDLIHLGKLEFKVIATPGHTKGGLCLYCEEEKMIFTGDTIFSGTWGRTDLPTGSMEDIMDSITNKILVLPGDTFIYPGHGRATRVEDEKPIYLELRKKDF